METFLHRELVSCAQNKQKRTRKRKCSLMFVVYSLIFLLVLRSFSLSIPLSHCVNRPLKSIERLASVSHSVSFGVIEPLNVTMRTPQGKRMCKRHGFKWRGIFEGRTFFKPSERNFTRKIGLDTNFQAITFLLSLSLSHGVSKAEETSWNGTGRQMRLSNNPVLDRVPDRNVKSPNMGITHRLLNKAVNHHIVSVIPWNAGNKTNCGAQLSKRNDRNIKVNCSGNSSRWLIGRERECKGLKGWREDLAESFYIPTTCECKKFNFFKTTSRVWMSPPPKLHWYKSESIIRRSPTPLKMLGQKAKSNH